MESATAKERLIEHKMLVAGYVWLPELTRRRQADESWDAIRDWVRDETGEVVTKQSLINWHPELNKPAAELAEVKG